MNTPIIRIKAVIKLYSDVRRTPFSSGYRPLFDFIKETKTSGQITLLDREAFYPGDEGIVEIAFLIRRALGDNFFEGTKFTFGEGRKLVGEGTILEILEY